MTLLRCLTFPLGSLTVTLKVLLFRFIYFLSSDANICSSMIFPLLGNSDHVFVSVSIDFPSNSKRNAPCHLIAYGYYCADWNGLRDHLRDVPWKDIFKEESKKFLRCYFLVFSLENDGKIYMVTI